MGKAYKNFWSLNTDEAVVAGILRDETNKNIEVLMPMNAQMKDIDLVAVNVKRDKLTTIQVKGSRAYEPKKKETEKYGDGSGGWFFFPRRVLNKSSAEWFIFLIYAIEQSTKKGRRILKPHTITIPTKIIKKLAQKHKRPHGSDMYSFYFWVNPKTKKSFDFRDDIYYVSEYLDRKGFEKLNKILK